MGLFKWIGRLVGLALLAVVFLGAYLYFTDAAVEATVTERGSDYAVVTPKLVPTWDYRVALDPSVARVVCEGYEVEFHVQSHDLIIYKDKGKPSEVVVYSDVGGKKTQNTNENLRCGATNTGLPVV